MDEGPRECAQQRGTGRHQGDFAHRAGRHERLCKSRQRVRVLDDERIVVAAGDCDTRAGVVQRQEPDFGRLEGFL